MHKLMIKTHNVTGLKYLCYTKKAGSSYDEYLGSGKLWKEHLKQYGKDILIQLHYEFLSSIYALSCSMYESFML